MAEKASLAFVLMLITGMVIMGSANTILLKLQYETSALGVDGTVHLFSHPWFQTLNMFLGEIICLIAFYVGAHYDSQQKIAIATQGRNVPEEYLRATTMRFTKLHDEGDEPAGPTTATPEVGAGPGGSYTPRTVDRIVAEKEDNFQGTLMALPGALDLCGTTLSGIGLLYTPASIWQMLRGSIILFTGLFSRVFLKRVLHGYNYAGMAIVTIGLAFVGYAGMAAGDTGNQDTAQNLLGMGLVLLGMVMNAGQFVIEEVMLKDKKYPPLKVVGWEGIWGASLTAFIAIPICYMIRVKKPDDPSSGEGVQGRYDNIVDVFVMFSNNWLLVFYSVAALFSISSYNYFGLSISQHVSSLTRAVMDSLRTIVIWAFFLWQYYYTDSDKRPDSHKVGEAWTSSSWYEVAGFIVLVFGTSVYAGAIRLPGFDYSNLDNAADRKETDPYDNDAYTQKTVTTSSAHVDARRQFMDGDDLEEPFLAVNNGKNSM